MFRNLLRFAIAASICTIPNMVLAQPVPNKRGDYYDGNWSEWLVVRDRK
jgi:hypothetical protein